MKKLLFLLVVLIPVLVFGQKAKIEFESTSYNFGDINENGGNATCEFTFKNTGGAPLILINVHAGCGCTIPEWNRQPIVPGATGKVKVSYNPKNRPGSFVKSVTVNSNAENPVISLTIRGNVSRKADPFANLRFAAGPLKLTNNSIDLGKIKNTQIVEKSLEIYNPGEAAATIEVISKAPHLTVTVTPATLNKGEKGTIQIKYNAENKKDWGFVNDLFQIKVNNNIVENITVTATIEEDFSKYNNNFDNAPVATLSETQFVKEDAPKNSTQTHDFYIQNDGQSDLLIHKIKTSDGDVSVNVAKNIVKPGKKVKASVTFKTKEQTKVIKVIQFTVNDPKQPMISYRVIANVK